MTCLKWREVVTESFSDHFASMAGGGILFHCISTMDGHIASILALSQAQLITSKMAGIVATKIATDLFFVATLLFLLALSASSSEAASCKYKSPRLKETNLVFCLHDYYSGRNITVVDIAGPANQPFDMLKFGKMVAIDKKLTESPEWNSPQVGRGHGMYANTAVDNRDLHSPMSFVFTNREFNGSTLEIQGSDDFNYEIRELSVVSGTGKLQMAQGFALLSTISF